MSDTYTWSFTDPKNPQDKYTLTVKSSFLEKCPKPEGVTNPFALETELNFSEYWHNPIGPAMIYPDGSEEYWIDGKYLSEEDTEKLKHRIRFNNKLENIINT